VKEKEKPREPLSSPPSRTLTSYDRAPRPQQRRGLLTEIQTPLLTESFEARYTLSVGRELGRGKFAVVKKCINRQTEKEFAAKFMRKRRKGQDCRMDIIHEIAVLELAQCNQWVINLHEVYETPTEIILVLEYAAGGEIFDQCVAEREDAFKEKVVKHLMRQILQGVSFLHQNNIVHLDLKLQNILLTCESPLEEIRIIDFGLSRIMKNNEELREIMGTPEYVAPEILSYDPISTATDMWSIGVLTYVMLTGVSPFLGNDKQETFLNISQINVNYSEDFDLVSEPAVDFIKSLLIKKPEKRATAEECLLHSWLAQTDIPDKISCIKNTEDETNGVTVNEVSISENSTNGGKTEEPVVTELILKASYTPGQCRQSKKDKIEPFLHEIPGVY
uniref:Serine/threonine-protein kinase 17A n=1 Tax=Naja naja TaxID=35670 RepID=A0A8C6YBA1_NAJNA